MQDPRASTGAGNSDRPTRSGQRSVPTYVCHPTMLVPIADACRRHPERRPVPGQSLDLAANLLCPTTCMIPWGEWDDWIRGLRETAIDLGCDAFLPSLGLEGD